jgi:hypothetical protein
VKTGLINKKLDEVISPTLTARDKISSDVQDIKHKIEGIKKDLEFSETIAQYTKESSELEEKISKLNQDISDIQKRGINLDGIISRFSALFSDTLRSLHFPKVDVGGGKPSIDKNLMPHVRGMIYRDIGSSGAAVIINQAWFIAMFKLFKEFPHHHPLFFIVDSPGKTIGRWKEESDEDVYSDESIVKSIYSEYLALVKNECLDQVIIVDHEEPAEFKSSVCVRFSRNKNKPPYGFIDDETGDTSPEGEIKDAILALLSVEPHMSLKDIPKRLKMGEEKDLFKNAILVLQKEGKISLKKEGDGLIVVLK